MHVVAARQVSVVSSSELEQSKQQQNLLRRVHQLGVIGRDQIFPNVQRTRKLSAKRLE
jgi:hypothetical protein